MCLLLPKSASATIGRRRINRIGFFPRSPFTAVFLFFMSLFGFLFYVTARFFYFLMSLPGLIGQSVYRRRLIFQILRSSRSMTTKNIITRLALSCHARSFIFYVIARLDRAICLLPPLNFPDTPVKPEYDNKKTSSPDWLFPVMARFFIFYVIVWLSILCHCPTSFLFMSLPGLTGQSGCLSHNRPS